METNYQLKSDWNVISLAFNYGEIADILNHVISDGVTAKAINVLSPKNAIRINDELERRGIDFKISKTYTKTGIRLLSKLLLIPIIIEANQYTKAVNLLAEDYNSRGC